jgi:hypothetical protein
MLPKRMSLWMTWRRCRLDSASVTWITMENCTSEFCGYE